MKKIGITGGIGSGKSTVCRMFEMLGTPVFYADADAKWLLANDDEVKNAVVLKFGNDLLNDNKELDRKKIANYVFSNPENLKALNEIIHPLVAKRFDLWCCQHQSAPYVLEEAAILFESGANKFVDKVLMVFAPVELRIKRVKKRDNFSEDEIKRRMSNQMNEDEKMRLSDYVIVNDEQQLLIEQVLDMHKLLISDK